MTEKDLDITIEKCERIMEMDTRTLKNPESENGYIFEKVYDLLKFLRGLQFATGGMDDTISRQAAINAICEDGTRLERQGQYSMTMAERKQRDVDILVALPSATDTNVGVTDTISRAAVGDALNGIEISRNASWYEFYQKTPTAVGELPSAQRWIPCSERLPEDNEDVLFYTNAGERWLGWHHGFIWETHGFDFFENEVVAWMPLPPKLEGGNSDGVD